MLRPRTIIDPGAARSKLDNLAAAVRREDEGTEADPFDDAMVAAVVGLAEAMKAETDALADAEARVGRLARKP